MQKPKLLLRTLTNDGFGHHIVLPILAILAAGAIGAYLTWGGSAAVSDPLPKRGLVDDGAFASANKSVPSTVRDYTTGGSDNLYAKAILETGMRHTVLNVGMRELVDVDAATGETTYIAGALESRIANATAWNKAHPKQKLTVHVRLNVGGLAPDAWKTLSGTVTMTDPNFGGTVAAPRWWTRAEDGRYVYRELYQSSMDVLSDAIAAINTAKDTKKIIGSINIPGAAPKYPEPFIIYAASEPVSKTLVAAGFTAEEHKAFLQWLPSTVLTFDQIAIELALNPVENLDGDARSIHTDKLLYRTIAEDLIAKVGSRTVLTNYSLRTSFTKLSSTTEYGGMYAWMKDKAKGSPKVWIGVQMARPSRVAIGAPKSDPEQWDNVSKWAADNGFHFAETTGAGKPSDATVQPSKSNIWPKSYFDDSDDTSAQKSIRANFRNNAHP